MELKQHLSKLLKERGMTPAQLSRLSGVPTSTISDYLSGREPKKISHLKRIADVFQVSLDRLLFGVVEDKSTSFDDLLSDGWMSGLFEVKLRKVTRKSSGD